MTWMLRHCFIADYPLIQIGTDVTGRPADFHWLVHPVGNDDGGVVGPQSNRVRDVNTSPRLFQPSGSIGSALEVNGDKVPDEDAKKITVVNGPDGTWSLLSEGKEISKGTNSFDPTKKPKIIDFTATEGEGKGNLYLGIYELGENARKLCFAPPGKDRPTEFISMPGSEHILVTIEREKAK